MYRTNRGFTLVELLVVITIIGVLIALLLPGINSLREQSRQTKCLNNQKQVGEAILAYEVAKRNLPGVLNQVPGGAQYTWAEAMFPYLDHGDMWEQIRNNNVAAIQAMNLHVFICPNDPYLVDPTSTNYQALLSYAVNDNFFVSNLSNPPVDRNGNKVAPAILSRLTGRPNQSFPRGGTCPLATTIMLGENSGSGTTTTTTTTPRSGPWTSLTWPALTFQWTNMSTNTAAVPPVPTPWTISPNMMNSAHPNIVCVVFFDGHGEKVTPDTMYPQ